MIPIDDMMVYMKRGSGVAVCRMLDCECKEMGMWMGMDIVRSIYIYIYLITVSFSPTLKPYLDIFINKIKGDCSIISDANYAWLALYM